MRYDERMGARIAEIDWSPDKAGKEPVYRQIVRYFTQKIRSGAWSVGDRLPSQRVLAEKFAVNRSTVITALEELIACGMLLPRTGRGTVVASNTWSILMANAAPDWGRYLRSGVFQENVPTIRTINKLEFAPGVVRLGTGELSPELFPREMMKEILRRFERHIPSLNYLEPLGLPELRETISKRLAGAGIRAPASAILITSGSLQALQLISVGMLHRGATMYTETPSYIQSLRVFQSMGVNLSSIPMDEEGIRYWNIMRGKSKPQGALLYTIPSFHNPTGTLMSDRRRRELFRFCSDNRLPVIEDDAYGELWLDEPPPEPLKAMDEDDMILYLGTISKALAPGLRLGWLVGPPAVVERLGDVKMQIDYGASSLSQYILAELFASGLYDEYIRDLRLKLRLRREMALRLLETHFGDIAHWRVPAGGFYIWLQLRNGTSANLLFHAALEEKILINPGGVYGTQQNSAIRLSYSYAGAEELERGIGILARIARALSQA